LFFGFRRVSGALNLAVGLWSLRIKRNNSGANPTDGSRWDSPQSVVAFIFQRPLTPVEGVNNHTVTAATVEIVVSSSLHSKVFSSPPSIVAPRLGISPTLDTGVETPA